MLSRSILKIRKTGPPPSLPGIKKNSKRIERNIPLALLPHKLLLRTKVPHLRLHAKVPALPLALLPHKVPHTHLHHLWKVPIPVVVVTVVPVVVLVVLPPSRPLHPNHPNPHSSKPHPHLMVSSISE